MRASYAFVGALDRATALREDEPALRRHFESGSAGLLLVRSDGKVPIRGEPASLVRLVPRETPAAPGFGEVSFLGMGDDGALFAAPYDAADASPFPPEVRAIDVRTAGAVLSRTGAGLAAYARALLHWRSRKRYCGVCGAATRFDQGGHRALCTDAGCGQQYFPRTDPAIIVIVCDGPRCLLGRQPSWPDKRFSTLAGFVEPGETLEQAVAREVEEESGVRISQARYVASQPWPFPASLMLGFEADAAETGIRVGSELAEARWFDAAEMPEAIAAGELVVSSSLSISHFLIDRWYRSHTGHALPEGLPWQSR